MFSSNMLEYKNVKNVLLVKRITLEEIVIILKSRSISITIPLSRILVLKQDNA